MKRTVPMNVDINQALRFAGVKTPDENAIQAAQQAAEQVEQRVSPRYTYRVFDIVRTEQGIFLPDAWLPLPGNLAKTMLADCDRAVLLLCTLGAEFDQLLRTAQARDMAQALYIDACGSSFVEQGCDAAEKEIALHYPGLYLTDRFSPGYGDLPLDIQPVMLRALNAEKRLGVCAAPSFLLNPMKSVTALMGLSGRPQPARIRGCAFCTLKQNCAYRERGMACASST